METTKNICYTKGEGTVDHNSITKWSNKFCMGGKNLYDHARSDRPPGHKGKGTPGHKGNSAE